MSIQHTGQFENLDGQVQRYVQSWQPSDCQGVILFVHGLGEHTGRYVGLAKWFAERGFLVRVFDQQGHGRDERRRGCIDSYESLVKDIGLFLDWSRRSSDLPHLLLGHSMGGNLVINAALRSPLKIDGVISSSPMLRSKRPIASWYEMLARALLTIVPNYRLRSEIVVERLTDLEEEQEALRSDELFHSYLSLRLGAGLIDSGRWALANANKLSTPLLLTHGSDDYLTCPDASKEFAEKAGDHCEFRLLDEMLHDTFRCRDQLRARELFLDFARRRTQ